MQYIFRVTAFVYQKLCILRYKSPQNKQTQNPNLRFPTPSYSLYLPPLPSTS